MLAKLLRIMLVGAVLVWAAPPALSARAQGDYPLELCREAGFSTEEDFMMREGKAYDGDPYVSDGDVLSPNGQVCVRNRDLLQRFGVREDLGLDALDILAVDERLVAFSTELDSPHGNFGAGDLLFTNGASIPNAALLFRFDIPLDLGLDGVHFVGRPDGIQRFLDVIGGTVPEDWLGGKLQDVLTDLDIDIWFSVEGTWWRTEGQRPILDGDVLSARSGGQVLWQEVLLDPPIPAGLAERGVDFGLDALAGPREPERAALVFSTEILYRGETSFTDGDVLRVGGSVLRPNNDLIKAFQPAADFLGLDALSLSLEPPVDVCCVEFEEQQVGAQYAVGSTFTDAGVPITVEPFTWSNGTSTSGGMAVIGSGGQAGSAGNEANTNNINLAFDFPGTPSGLTLWFGEYGGNLNIRINGDFKNFADFADINGATIGGVQVAVAQLTPEIGVLALAGPIDDFAIGGQELWIDTLCPTGA